MTRHLLTVWNPSYAESIMDAHLEVLLAQTDERSGGSEEDATYVWWAKIKSPKRQQPLPHTSEVLALQHKGASASPPSGSRGVDGSYPV